MSTDPADKERDFIAEIAAETGRDLAAWMRAIDGSALGDRNATIDWLKAQHVFFNRASRAMWLERIHHNGGRPVYEGHVGVISTPVELKRVQRAPRIDRPATPAVTAAPEPAHSEVATVPTAVPASDSASPTVFAASTAEIETVLARGKAYRPLAALILSEIRKALPSVVVGTGDGVIVLGHPGAFASIDPRPKDVRLALALDGDAPGFERSRPTGPTAATTHVRVLTDARSIDAALIDLVCRTAVAR